MSRYDYLFPNLFPNGINESQLFNEIQASNAINVNCTRVDRNAEIVMTIFESALSVPEKAALDSIIVAHIPITIVNYSKIINGGMRTTSSNKTSWTNFGKIIFPGGTRLRAAITGYTTNNVSQFQIRVTNGANTILTKTVSGAIASETVIDLDIGTNIPSVKSIFLVDARVTSGAGTIYLDNLMIEYT